MDYKEKYEMALESIQEILDSGQDSIKMSRLQLRLQGIFPELKESEDERIRKEMIEILEKEARDFPSSVIAEKSNSWIAWLEKQGSQNLANSAKTCKEEQKPKDRVEQKFKVGDWVVFNNKHASMYQVEKIEDGHYILRHTHGGTLRVCVLHDESLRLWTIQDAKEGDVLATLDYILIFKQHLEDDGGVSYCNYDFTAYTPQFFWFEDKNWYFGKYAIVHPATKEQRELLFQKMREAGYEWDAEKKELKTIEQKPAWSEEDEQYLLVCKNALAKYQTTDKWDAHIIFHWLENKLKSLKERVQPQNTWKPSKEQMDNK